MIRAYGDRAFIPALQVALHLLHRFFWWSLRDLFFFVDLKGIVLIAFIWGVWHGMMQTYGFCRIYDAKVAHSLP